jgi:hypothetical protein
MENFFSVGRGCRNPATGGPARLIKKSGGTLLPRPFN